jgi:5-methylcytosine-specific restriction protein A
MKLSTLQPRLKTLNTKLPEIRRDGSFGGTDRRSRHERGYGTEWDKLREVILKRDEYQCQACKRRGWLTAAREVDHIVPREDGGGEEPSNLQSLCKPCHAEKTRLERRARGGALAPGGVGRS